MDLELVVNTPQIGLDGRVTNAEFCRDFLDPFAEGDSFEDFDLAFAQLRLDRGRFLSTVKRLDHTPGDNGRHGRTTPGDELNALNNFDRRGVFQQVTCGSRTQR